MSARHDTCAAVAEAMRDRRKGGTKWADLYPEERCDLIAHIEAVVDVLLQHGASIEWPGESAEKRSAQ